MALVKLMKVEVSVKCQRNGGSLNFHFVTLRELTV